MSLQQLFNSIQNEQREREREEVTKKKENAYETNFDIEAAHKRTYNSVSHIEIAMEMPISFIMIWQCDENDILWIAHIIVSI